MDQKPDLNRANTLKQINISISTKPKTLNYSTSLGLSQDQSNLYTSLPISAKKMISSDQILEYPFPKVNSQFQINLPTSADNLKLPAQIYCNTCKQPILTRVEKQYGVGALVVTCLILILFWPLFWIPCVVSECRDIIHYCPSCSEVVGQKPFKLCG